ncbi:MAG: hypothetical protein FD161_3312 [Limisphaerales bacterium]|nr:MAG: hypothetical protein FD161_3312 [Limisphaerales bacterium]KAG0507827.1 MAG: hypothetical protein E1N63_2978 [Limisphaerales bacterium]TXT48634.1 MAG: hypothetical protein FD140_3569 [Limisphaerales bacterium]
MARSELFASLIVDGSYVTAKPSPNDIDVLLSLRLGHDYTRDLNMSDYALVSRPLVRKQFGFDVLVATEGSPAYEEYVQFFARVRGLPDLRKGLLRIAL